MDGIYGGPNPANQTVILSNGGGGELGVLGVVETSPWLSTSPPGNTVTLAGDLGMLASGTFTATVRFSSVNGGEESVDVTLRVAEPILTLSAQGLSFTGLVNGSGPSGQDLTITNTGAGGLSNRPGRETTLPRRTRARAPGRRWCGITRFQNQRLNAML